MVAFKLGRKTLTIKVGDERSNTYVAVSYSGIGPLLI